MKDIIISVDSTSHKVNFPDEFLGIGYENLQGNLIFQFDNNFIGGQARLDISIDCESGMIPNLTPYENGYILPIKSSLLTGSNVLMQLVIDETSLTQYSLTTDTEINPNKTYYEKVGNDYIVVENPVVGDISQYYEANTPVFKTDIFQLKVKDSINAQETIPEQYPTWINTLNTLIGTINQKLGLVDTALTEMNNLNINVSDKVDGEVTITFTDKQGNQKEVKINDGRGIVSILKTATSGNIDTYTITYTDNTTSTFQVTNGIDGTDGVGIESIYLTGTSGLTDTYTILYTDGTTTEFQVKNGKGITKIEKISTNLLVDTYKITFNDGTTQNYEVTNGKGIVSIEKTSTEGLTDIYTITYNDKTTATFNVVNGKGIVSIEKTSTSGYVDTYTITYNDGTTSTYEVTNGEVSQAQLDALQNELNYYKTIVNALPKITGSGTSITLNNTADSILSNVLNPSELEQETTTGKNKCNFTVANTTIQGATYNGSEIRVTGTYNDNVYQGFNAIRLPAGTYTFSFQSSFSNGTYFLVKGNSTYGGNKVTFTLTEETNVGMGLVLYKGTYNNAYIKAQLESGSSDTSYEPFTGGIASPNPQYPSEVHTISGDNTILIRGIQLWDEEWETGSLAAQTGGNTSESQRIRSKNYIPIQPNTNYYYKVPNQYSSGRIAYYDKNKVYLGLSAGWKNITNNSINTSVANAYYMRICFVESNDTYNYDICINVSNDNINGTYEPYQEQTAQVNLGDLEYSKIGNTADVFMKPSGKNLANYLDIPNAPQWSSWPGNSKYIELTLKPNTQYTMSSNVPQGSQTLLYFNGDVTATNGVWLNNSKTMTSDNNGKIFYALFTDRQYYSDIISGKYYIMLNEGSTVLPYEPYNNGKWYLKKNIGKVVLDGSENWADFTEQIDTNYYACYETDKKFGGPTGTFITPSNYKCNYFTGYTSGLGDLQNYIASSGYATYVKIDNTIVNSAEAFKTWLSTHNVIVDYTLLSPTYTLLNNTLQSQLDTIESMLLSYKGQTNISQINNDLPFIIDSTALKDLTSL